MSRIRRFRDLFFATPRWYSYGGMIWSIFLAVNLAKYYGKRVVFFYPKNHFDGRYNYPGFLNRELEHIMVDNVVLECDSLLQKLGSKCLEFNRWVYRSKNFVAGAIRRMLRLLGWKLPIFWGYCGLEESRTISRSLGIIESVDWKAVLETPFYLDLTEAQKLQGQQILTDMGIPVESKFVCLYVRDAGYESKRSTSSPSVCNAKIKNFGPVIAYLESLDFYVIRVGDDSAMPFETGSGQFIDYVHSRFYSELMDLFLYRYCTFWVGTMGGARYFPAAYGRSCVVVNGPCLELLGHCVHRDDVYLPKHIYSYEEKRFLNLQEQLARVEELDEVHIFTNPNYLVVENTPEEILTATREFYDSKFLESFEWDLDLQECFHDLWFCRKEEAFYDADEQVWNKLTMESYVHIRPYVSQRFLQNCWTNSEYLLALSDYFNRQNTLDGFCLRS